MDAYLDGKWGILSRFIRDCFSGWITGSAGHAQLGTSSREIGDGAKARANKTLR